MLDRLIATMDGYILPGIDRKAEHPDMEMQRILAMGVATQSLCCNIDRLHELVIQHKTLHKLPGHADIWNNEHYHIQTLVDNVCLPDVGLQWDAMRCMLRTVGLAAPNRGVPGSYCRNPSKCGKACNGVPKKGGIGDQIGRALICCRNSFSSSNDGTASRVDLRREDRAGPAVPPPNCPSVPQWSELSTENETPLHAY